MISEEAVIEMNPDVIIATYDYVEDIEEGIMSRDGWGDITAVQDEAVVVVDTDLVSRPGPRLVEGALESAKAIYPDVFNELDCSFLCKFDRFWAFIPFVSHFDWNCINFLFGYIKSYCQ